MVVPGVPDNFLTFVLPAPDNSPDRTEHIASMKTLLAIVGLVCGFGLVLPAKETIVLKTEPEQNLLLGRGGERANLRKVEAQKRDNE